jgi:hypothetical protein
MQQTQQHPRQHLPQQMPRHLWQLVHMMHFKIRMAMAAAAC